MDSQSISITSSELLKFLKLQKFSVEENNAQMGEMINDNYPVFNLKVEKVKSLQS